MDARTPVIVGVGQVDQRGEPQDCVDPVALMARAAGAAASAALLESIDTIHVVNLLSWRYRNPGALLARHLRCAPRLISYSGVGGNTPQSLVNRACSDIAAGRTDVVLLAGGEAWRTRMKLRDRGERPDWPRQDDTVNPPEPGADVALGGEAEERIGLDRPAYVYPLFEQAIRIANQEGIQEHRRRIGSLWSTFSDVAVTNPHAWSPRHCDPEEIWQPGPRNRMVAWPYTKLLNSNNMVDQAAVVVLTSVSTARRFGISSDRWVFPHAGTDAHDTYAVAERAELHRSPAIRIAARRVLELCDLGIDDIGLIDIYSCFPSAVQVAAHELGLPPADPRPLTVTGGLTFAGGPWNNYVMHAIATTAHRLREQPDDVALVTANGGYLTKHSIGIYGGRPPAHEFRWEDVQSDVDRLPVRKWHPRWSGRGVVESWTAPFHRDGHLERLLLAVRTPEGARTLAAMTDPSITEAALEQDFADRAVSVHPDGTASFE